MEFPPQMKSLNGLKNQKFLYLKLDIMLYMLIFINQMKSASIKIFKKKNHSTKKINRGKGFFRSKQEEDTKIDKLNRIY